MSTILSMTTWSGPNNIRMMMLCISSAYLPSTRGVPLTGVRNCISSLVGSCLRVLVLEGMRLRSWVPHPGSCAYTTPPVRMEEMCQRGFSNFSTVRPCFALLCISSLTLLSLPTRQSHWRSFMLCTCFPLLRYTAYPRLIDILSHSWRKSVWCLDGV